jgi:hypothetical protein
MNSQANTFVALIKEYKELIATIVFFVGGVLWIFGYFATKEELRGFREAASTQNKVLHCLLEKHVQLLEGKQKWKLSSDELMTVQEDIRKQVPTSAQFSENDIRKSVRLEQQREEIRTRISSAEKEITEATNAIMYRECEK